jgi:translation elongation factor EF-G
MTDINQPTYYQFFESAMEWKESVYEFYQENNAPQKENIHKSIQNFHIDQAFSEYSDNKHVRVMVPVTPDFNYQMLYYLSTGLVPYTANPITPIIESDKPIAVALKKTTDTDIVPHMTDESWEIVVPTNMQWLQDGDELPFNNIEIISIS